MDNDDVQMLNSTGHCKMEAVLKMPTFMLKKNEKKGKKTNKY